MQVQLELPADEIKRLQRCMNDLISLLALPAMWSGSPPSDIVHTLLDSLLRMLDLDFVYVSLTDLIGTASSETVKVAQSQEQSQEQMFQPRELCRFLNRWLGDDPLKRYLQERSRIGDEEISLVSWPLGVQREIGVIVAGSRRADFPQDTEALLLGIAANQALTGLQQARLLTEQKRVADELDQRVGQRTAELAAQRAAWMRQYRRRKRAGKTGAPVSLRSAPSGVRAPEPSRVSQQKVVGSAIQPSAPKSGPVRKAVHSSFKTALQLARTFPFGVLASRACPYCYNSGYSSPGTQCSYCARQKRRGL